MWHLQIERGGNNLREGGRRRQKEEKLGELRRNSEGSSQCGGEGYKDSLLKKNKGGGVLEIREKWEEIAWGVTDKVMIVEKKREGGTR